MSEYSQNQATEYRADIVFCIDGTGSMKPMINKVKQTAKDFYTMFLDAMQKNDPPKAVKDDGLRVKVIVFRDFADTSSVPLEESGFYNLQDPGEYEAFVQFVDNIQHDGGGDLPENALEAIATALKSQWQPLGGKYRRQAIVVFTDTLTYDLNNPERRAASNYPSGMPKNVEELFDIWNAPPEGQETESPEITEKRKELAPYYVPKCGRLIVFAPTNTGMENDSRDKRTIDWQKFATWERTWIVPVRPDGGCDEIDFQQALDVLVGSF